MRQAYLLALLFLSVAWTGCQSSAGGLQPTGYVQPTVAGRPVAAFSSLQEGRRAFTRAAGSLRATLEDASWLKFEGPPATVEAAHRGYFEYGYTTFAAELRSKEYTQPTRERFVLKDSQGRSVVGRPLAFTGAPELVDDRYFSAFTLSFRHMITPDLTWIRLIREADGSSLEWSFGPAPAPAR